MTAQVLPGLEIPPQYGWPLFTAIVLAITGYIIQKALKNKPGAPTVTEAWEETRLVRGELNDFRAAVDVFFHWMERAISDWNTGKPIPRLSPRERAVLDKIRPLPEEMLLDPAPSGSTGPVGTPRAESSRKRKEKQ